MHRNTDIRRLHIKTAGRFERSENMIKGLLNNKSVQHWIKESLIKQTLRLV